MIRAHEKIRTSERRSDGVPGAPRQEADGDRPETRSDVVLHELDGEALLFDPETQSTHRLNETGFLIWDACDGSVSVDDIATRLVDKYAVDRDEAHAHVAHLVKELRRQRLLVGSQKEPLLAPARYRGLDPYRTDT